MVGREVRGKSRHCPADLEGGVGRWQEGGIGRRRTGRQGTTQGIVGAGGCEPTDAAARRRCQTPPLDPATRCRPQRGMGAEGEGWGGRGPETPPETLPETEPLDGAARRSNTNQ